MMKLRATLLATALAALLPVSLVHAQPIDRIAAVVNEDVILQSELDRAIANITAQYAGSATQLPPADVLARQVLERLVLTRLQVSRARESGIVVSDQEVAQAIAGIAQQNGFSPEQLQAQLARDGMTMDDFRRSLHDEIAIQRLRQSFAQSRVQVSEAEVNAALSQARGGTASGTQYHLAHILVALPEGATPEQIATGQQKIDGIKSLIDRGEMDFAAAAVRYSDSPNALEGGDLGWRPESEIPPAFVNEIKTLQAGQMLGPIRGSSGFQLVRLVETRSAAESGPMMLTQYHLRHILIRSEGGADDAAARAKLETLRARANGGVDFAKLAREESQDPGSRDNGGDIGWVDAEALGPVAAKIATLRDGQISEPMQVPGGWHIVQRVAERRSEVSDDQQRAVIRENIGRRKLEDEYNRFLQEMRGDAYVDVRSESVLGARSNEG
ncbi:molecular chaperone SurA [Lysobacteraceae bacterium NML120232]|nr:molecular chaperone SurA [Xanthomonadaceae bacterium NML08-0793]PJK12122.1 molecular chaperone SurA [Xanthomonadaceae bacterium NML120232]